MTILTQKVGSGPTRRCDSACHHAKRDKCACICGGRYHGKGALAQELLQRDVLDAGWDETKARMGAPDGFPVRVASPLQQLQLLGR